MASIKSHAGLELTTLTSRSELRSRVGHSTDGATQAPHLHFNSAPQCSLQSHSIPQRANGVGDVARNGYLAFLTRSLARTRGSHTSPLAFLATPILQTKGQW